MAEVAFDPITAGLQFGGKLLDHFFPDPAQAAAAKLQLLTLAQNGELAQLTADTDLAKAGASIVLAEANSSSWLTRNWRPVTMLVLLGLVVARWFGFAATNLQPTEYTQLWNLVQLGIGGYVAGRTIEKVAPSIVGAIASNKQ